MKESDWICLIWKIHPPILYLSFWIFHPCHLELTICCKNTSHCVDIWNWRYLDFYQGPMTIYLHLYSTNFVSQFLLWSSIRIYLQSSHYEDYHYIFLCCECQSLSMPDKACPKAKSFLVWGLFFHWFLNYARGRAFRREISNIHTVAA